MSCLKVEVSIVLFVSLLNKGKPQKMEVSLSVIEREECSANRVKNFNIDHV
jgi:hypothetical protein